MRADVSNLDQPAPPSRSKPINLLAYVHLRNIHASTGAGRVARQLTEHLAQRDDTRVHILADATDHARILPLVQQPWTDYTYHTFASDTSRQQASWFLFDRPAAEHFWPDVEVVFCTAESYVPVKSARLVVTLHDAAYFEPSAHRRDRAFLMQQLKWKLLYNKLARKADMFHTVSHFSAERLGHFFPDIASRIRVVHNAVTPHFLQPVTEEGQSYLTRTELAGKPFILLPGGLQFRKNADLVLDAAASLQRRLPDLPIVVTGHSDPVYVEQAKARQLELRLSGFTNEGVLHALYSNATIVWFPSRYEGFGLPVIEAMACGTPVVCSSAASLPEIAGDAAILVDPGKPLEHADAIEALISDARQRQQLSDAGRSRASAFTWAASASQLRQLFETLL